MKPHTHHRERPPGTEPSRRKKPLISNYAVLNYWIKFHHGHRLWQLPNDSHDPPASYIEGWQIIGDDHRPRVAILQIFGNLKGLTTVA